MIFFKRIGRFLLEIKSDMYSCFERILSSVIRLIVSIFLGKLTGDRHVYS
jgi:hypothetical protein